MSFLVLQSSWWGKESLLLYFDFFPVSCDFYCSEALPQDAMGLQCVVVVFPDHTYLPLQV